MLTNKEQRFIESIAVSLQARLEIIKKPNIYSFTDILKFLDNLGYKVIFNCQNNELKENSILLSFDESQTENNEEKFVEMLQILFKYIWIITKKKADVTMVKYNDADANYFVRAMLMPEEVFMEAAIDNVDLEGMCNIFNVAKVFKVDYLDVSARGKDLGCFNPKGKE